MQKSILLKITEYKLKKLSLISGIITIFIIAAAINFYPQNNDQSRGERFKGRMFDKLNLTDEQKTKIEDLRIQHQKAMIDLRADMQKKRLAVKEIMLKGNYSRSDYLNLVNDLNSARNMVAASMANHRMDVYELLTDQQKKIFDQMPMMGGHRSCGGMMDGNGPMGRHTGKRAPLNSD